MGCTHSTKHKVEHPIPQPIPNTNPRQQVYRSCQNQVIHSPDISYNFPIGEQIDFNCPSGHPLFKITEEIYSNNQYICNLCGETNNIQTNPTSHCQDCEFDICPKCLAEQKDIKEICPSGHRLFRVCDLEAFHHQEEAYTLNAYLCDLCGRSRVAKEDPVYHCSQCKFDMCPLCYRQQHKSEYYCTLGHRLYRVTDLKTFNDGQAYNNNTYGCHFCKKVLQAEEYPAMHCSECRYDVCHDCMKTHIIDSGIPNSEENKESAGRKESVHHLNNGVDNKMGCVMCLKENRSYVFEPCKHFCACEKCAWMLFNDKKPCPICRREIKDITKIFVV